MPFNTRNQYYLRISEKNVLPVYLYLDERHLGWMSDLVLQHVLSDLRPHILPKLKAEADIHPGTSQSSSKKASVDTHRGETYQFCYFIRRTEPHSVIFKTRNFVAAPPRKLSTMPSPPVPSTSKSQRSKRKTVAGQKTNYQNTRKRRKTKGKSKKRAEEEEELALSSSEEQDADTDLAQNTVQPRRSGRIMNLLEGEYRETDEDVGTEALDEEQYIGDEMAHAIGEDVQPDHLTASSANMPPYGNGTDRMEVDGLQVQDAPPSTLEIEIEEDEKPKPMLQLKYQGFNIYGHCLCIVVEPWPPIRSISRAPSIFAATPHSRAPSIAPLVSESNFRARTPLFLPDDADRERSETPAPFQGRKVLPPVPSFHVTDFAGDSDDSDEGGMMEFSQILNKAGDFRAGAADDDEDMDGAGAVFFGDADEAREF